MNFEDGTAFLDFAKELLKDPNPSNAKLRTIVSRIYYAAFLRARFHLRRKENVQMSNVDVHAFVINKFRDGNSSDHLEIANILFRLRQERNQADYQANYNVTLINAKLLLSSANRFFSLIAKL